MFNVELGWGIPGSAGLLISVISHLTARGVPIDAASVHAENVLRPWVAPARNHALSRQQIVDLLRAAEQAAGLPVSP